MNAEHDAHIATISEWLSSRSAEDLSVDVVTGPNRVPIARGRYLGMEAHPSAEGVHKLNFDDSLGGGEPGPGPKWVTVGHELVGVTASDDMLVLDKGSQRIEVRTAASAASAADGTVAGAPPAAPASPPSSGPSVLDAFVGAYVASAKAPLYQNSAILAARCFGPTEVEVQRDEFMVTTRRMSRGTPFFVLTGVIFFGFALAPLLLIAITTLGSGGMAIDEVYIRQLQNAAVVLAVIAGGSYGLGYLLSSRAKLETLTFPLGEVKVRRYRRLYLFTLPMGKRDRKRRLVLRPSSKADAEVLKQIMAEIRK